MQVSKSINCKTHGACNLKYSVPRRFFLTIRTCFLEEVWESDEMVSSQKGMRIGDSFRG